MTLTVGALVARMADGFKAAGIETARLDARLLLAHALGCGTTAIFSHPERPLSADELAEAEALMARRQRREPVSHILGRREFWSLSFAVTADTLDPRPDTETVVEAVLAQLPDRAAPLRLLDFGTGTGCILLALLSELPNARGLGVDISPAALAVATTNAQSLGMAQRVSLTCADWGRGIDGLFDVITANPPYIPNDEIAGLEAEVAAFEPRGALAGGPDGLDCYRALAPHIARLLAPGGVAALEVGKGQDQAVGSLLQETGLSLAGTRLDLAGVGRCVIASRPL
jgi:release factor glutamine methyltransferase